jgi:hypothetical protein
MAQPEYERKISVLVLPHIWIGAACWPFMLQVGVTEFSSYGFYIALAIFFLLAAIFSIFHGIRALKYGVYSDFIMLAIIPCLLPMVLGILYYLK